MQTYKQLRRTRKLKKFGKKVVIAILFLGISYLLSLLSFYIYTQLSQILQPAEKGFLGFAIIGVIAGLVAVLVSFANKRLVLTVVISFLVDCLVNSIILFSSLGTKVISFLPGLMVGMFTVVGSGYLLRRKFGFLDISILSPRCLKEKDYKKYALARKLLENPNKITMTILNDACGLFQDKDVDPKIGAVLKEVDNFTRALGGDVAGFIVAHIKTETEKDEEKKEKVLFFIDLINDIKEEIDFAFVRIGSGEAKNFVDHPIKQAHHSYIASAATSANNPSIVATIVAGSVIATSAAGIIPGLPLISQNVIHPKEIQSTQGIVRPTQTATPTILPTETPTPKPTNKPAIIFSAVEKTFFVSAPQEGTIFTVNASGTYRFTIIGGAAEISPQKSQPNYPEQWGWQTKLLIYKNRAIAFGPTLSGLGNPLVGWIYLMGDPNLKPTAAEAEQSGKGKYIDLTLNKDDYLIFIVDDSDGGFVDNNGGVSLQVQKGV
ncbi:MAG: hypothetical protein WC841_01115 [Candidatus Shapirobacteria bacterium]|jgi:hypothetical protein